MMTVQKHRDLKERLSNARKLYSAQAADVYFNILADIVEDMLDEDMLDEIGPSEFAQLADQEMQKKPT